MKKLYTFMAETSNLGEIGLYTRAFDLLAVLNEVREELRSMSKHGVQGESLNNDTVNYVSDIFHIILHDNNINIDELYHSLINGDTSE